MEKSAADAQSYCEEAVVALRYSTLTLRVLSSKRFQESIPGFSTIFPVEVLPPGNASAAMLYTADATPLAAILDGADQR